MKTLLYHSRDAHAKYIAEALRVGHGFQTQEFDGPKAPAGTSALLTVRASAEGSCLHNRPAQAPCVRMEDAGGWLPTIHIVKRGRDIESVPIPAWAEECDEVYAIELNVQNIYNQFARMIATGTVPTLHMA